MGLDMYLSAKRYIGSWNLSSAEEKAAHQAVLEAVGMSDFRSDGSPSVEVEINVAYWRKANAIHRWFVEHVQEGEDDCDEYGVSDDQLKKLVDDCEKVLGSIETVDGLVSTGETMYADGTVEHHAKPGQVVAQAGLAEKLMPTQGGFFFGKTEYDEDYLNDLRSTVKQVRRILDDPRFEQYTFYYRASW